MKPYLRITLWYLLFGALWISVTDRLLGPVPTTVEAMTGWQTIKGWLYVLASGALVYFLAQSAQQIQEIAEQKRLKAFKRTVSQSHHILLNYLNQMELFFLEAERSADFDKNLVLLARRITDETAAAVRDLENQAEAAPEAVTAPPGT
ncbi:MAG: hypothetical protein ACOYM3_04090 [Terrimicrobiaceae bacterium]